MDVGAAQGGDPRFRPATVRIDLSTCVSRYGPPDGALAAIRNLRSAALHEHPYEAASALIAAYGAYLGVPTKELVVGRGISELIWQLAFRLPAGCVTLPLPAYTEYHQAFPTAARLVSTDVEHHDLSDIACQLEAGQIVLLSNPHNPTGRAFSRAQLLEVAHRPHAGVLVVDESYVEFCRDPASVTVIGAPLGNIVVLRSPSKFFGIAGARVGVAWSGAARGLDLLTASRGSWPVSAVEVAAAAAALEDWEWAAANRENQLSDVEWLEDHISHLGQVVPGAVTHFRLLRTPAATRIAQDLAAAGLGVRVFDERHGLTGPALRITAPRREDRGRVAAMLHSVVGS